MSKESKVVQVYPSDAKVQESMDENAIFGWEVINNQKFQEFTHSSIGLFSNTNHYSTYVKITYQRERSESWYPRVAELEKEYESLNNKIRRLRRRTDLKMITHHFFCISF